MDKLVGFVGALPAAVKAPLHAVGVLNVRDLDRAPCIPVFESAAVEVDTKLRSQTSGLRYQYCGSSTLVRALESSDVHKLEELVGSVS